MNSSKAKTEDFLDTLSCDTAHLLALMGTYYIDADGQKQTPVMLHRAVFVPETFYRHLAGALRRLAAVLACTATSRGRADQRANRSLCAGQVLTELAVQNRYPSFISVDKTGHVENQ